LTHGWKEPKIAPTREKIIEAMKVLMMECIHNPDMREKHQHVLMDLVDILLEFSPGDGKELLEYLRKTKITANEFGVTKDGTKGTVYADAQSAHNETLSLNAKKIALHLCNSYYPGKKDPKLAKEEKLRWENEIEISLEQHFELFLKKEKKLRERREKEKKNLVPKLVNECLNRIYSDNLPIAENRFAQNLLYAIWGWMEENPKVKRSVELRLAEEVLEMSNYCSTRIIEGLVNSIQGFTDPKKEPELELRISTEDQVKGVVFTYLQHRVEACGDQAVMDGLLLSNEPFIRFVRGVVNEKRMEWMKEYGEEFSEKVSGVVNEWCGGTKIFDLGA
jgi:hypothetical protein